MIKMQTLPLCSSPYLCSSVPWLDMWGSNPWLRILGAIWHLRGLNPWPRVLEATLQPAVHYGALYVVLQEATTRMVDCNEGMQNRAMQQPNKLLRCIAGASNDCKTTTLLPQWSHPTSCRKRLWRRQQRLNAMRAQACATTANRFHRCGWTTSTIAKARDASNEIDCDATTTTLTMQQLFSLYVVLQGVATVVKKAGEEQNNSHATIKLSCCYLQDATMTILRHAMISGASTPRSYVRGEYAKDGVQIRQRRRVRCQGRIWQVRKGGCICQRKQLWSPCHKGNWLHSW